MKWNFLLSLLVGVLSWIVGVDASHHHSQKVFIDDAQPYFITENATTAFPTYNAYWNVDAATHQQNTDRLKSQNYRPISFSVYGNPPKPNVRYAAIWVQRPGPDWVAAHNMNLGEFVTWSQKWAREGFVSSLVSATGPEGSSVFMGLMEKNGVGWFDQRCEIDATGFGNSHKDAWAKGQILKGVREYGTPAARRYCAIWWSNPQQDKWTYYYPLSYDAYQLRFESEMSKPFWRPTYVTESEDHQITSIWGDTDVGNTWNRHRMTASDLNTEMNAQKSRSLFPIHLSGGGAGSDTRFIGFWAQQDQPTLRSWRATGTARGFKNNPAAIASVDSVMQTFTKAAGVRQAQVAVGKNGNILLERAYSWSESTRHTTQPNDIFLLASVSKMFCAAAIQNLFDRRILYPTDKVYAKLGYTGTPNDRRVNDITIQDLIDHKGGDDVSTNKIDTVFYMRQIARNRGGSSPATLKDITDFTFQRRLDYTPGTLGCKDKNNSPTYCYSNQGYLILSALVEKLTSQNYFDFLRANILNNLDVRVWRTDMSFHTNDPITQESANTGCSALNPLASNPVANIFGGDGIYKESAVGPSSLSASASSLVKFVATHAVWGNGGRAPNMGREGSMDGARTIVVSRGDGVDWALVVSTRDFKDSGENPPEGMWNAAINGIGRWLDGGPVA